MSNVYGYVRVSTDRQAKSQLGLAAQTRTIQEYARRVLRSTAQIICDPGVSASAKPLRTRPQGRRMNELLQSGDAVVIAKLDRGFRSLADFAATMADWHQRGISIHLLDLQVDTSTPIGSLIAGIMAAVAQWESRRIGERIKDARATLRAQGFAINGKPRIGYRMLKSGRLLPCPKQRANCARIVALRKRGKLWREIAVIMQHERRKTAAGGPWSQQACWRGYHAARAKYRWEDRP